MTSAGTDLGVSAVDDFETILVDAGSAADQSREGIIGRLRERAGRVESWHMSVLRAMGEWNAPHEDLTGDRWHYVIGGEALDWLTLAQRLCLEIPDAVPQHELEALLFRGRWPEPVSAEMFRELIGPFRYTAVLNFRYGVVVEEALQLVAEDSMRKSRWARCYQDNEGVTDDAYRHLYGETQSALAERFLAETAGVWGTDPDTLSVASWNEFTYWLFKLRVRKWHPARVASDTRRGLERLRELHEASGGNATDWVCGMGLDPPALLSGR